MKKLRILSLFFAATLALGLTACNGKKIEPKGFVDWVNEEGSWRTVSPLAFKDEEKHRPSDGDVKRIARAISMTPTIDGSSDYMCVVLKDRMQQEDVVGLNNANDGTVTFLVFGSNLSSNGNGNSNNGYYHLGIASGYANLAAISMGYGTRFYTNTNYSDPQATYQRSIEDVYLKDKNYKYIGSIDSQSHDAYGNMQFVCAIVVGKPNEDAANRKKGDDNHKNVIIADEISAGELARLKRGDSQNENVRIDRDMDEDIYVDREDDGDFLIGNDSDRRNGDFDPGFRNNDNGDDKRQDAERDDDGYRNDGEDDADEVIPLPDDGGTNVGGGNVVPSPPDARRIVVFSHNVF